VVVGPSTVSGMIICEVAAQLIQLNQNVKVQLLALREDALIFIIEALAVSLL
jgi:hypothetical protein